MAEGRQKEGAAPRGVPPSAGLCAVCGHARLVESARGSAFVLCALSQTDARFAKYPRLPVVACEGYEPRGNADDGPNGV